MELEIDELSNVCSVIRTYLPKAKHINKKNRLKNALKKLERQLVFKESKLKSEIYTGRYLTFRKNNLCPTCHQPKIISTAK